MNWLGWGVGLVAAAWLVAGAARGDGLVQQVVIEDVEYAPPLIQVRIGEAVEWTNADPVAHTATSSDGSWEVDLQPGESGRHVMTQTGTFAYLCRYHPNMTGKVEVLP